MSLTHWNYRLLKYTDGSVGIHEVYYRNNRPVACSERAVGIVADSSQTLPAVLERVAKALSKPPLLHARFKSRSP